jgi:hypothetical protein
VELAQTRTPSPQILNSESPFKSFSTDSLKLPSSVPERLAAAAADGHLAEAGGGGGGQQPLNTLNAQLQNGYVNHALSVSTSDLNEHDNNKIHIEGPTVPALQEEIRVDGPVRDQQEEIHIVPHTRGLQGVHIEGSALCLQEDIHVEGPARGLQEDIHVEGPARGLQENIQVEGPARNGLVLSLA